MLRMHNHCLQQEAMHVSLGRKEGLPSVLPGGCDTTSALAQLQSDDRLSGEEVIERQDP